MGGQVIGGMSTERLSRIDAFMDKKYVAEGKIPGALTLVSRHGEVAHFSGIGQMDAERGKPMKEDTIFRIYSMSKPITSVALMMLYEEGHFQLEDPVHKFIPEWEDLKVVVSGAYPNFTTRRPERDMSMRDILSHQAGLTYSFHFRDSVDAAYRDLRIFAGGAGLGLPDETLAEQVKKMADLPLLFTPGTRWNYSVATDICGYLIEVISGKPFDTYLQENLFGPLGMVDTAFHVPAEKADRFAACYAPTPDGKGMSLQDDPGDSDYLKPPKLLSGGGGLVSTAGDYAKFCQMLLNGGHADGNRFLSRKTIELMTTNHLPDGQDLAAVAPPGAFSEAAMNGTGFGLGFSVLMDLRKAQIAGSPGQFAWGGAASTAFWIDPVEDLFLVFMTQLLPSSTYPFRRELQVFVNAAIEE